MAGLSPANMLQRDWRVDKFIDKYKNKDPFELNLGGKVTLVYDKEKEKVLAKRNRAHIAQLRFVSAKGSKEYKITDFKKTIEFGGKGEGSGTIKEDIELESLRKQLEDLKKVEKSATVPIRIDSKTYQVEGAESTPGTPKSDFHLLDINGREIVWISHKDGSRPNDFQQWGGISDRSEPAIAKHIETKIFVQDVKDKYNNVMPRATTVARKIEDLRLQMMSVYGNEYGSAFGRQNVTMLIQGPVKLKKRGRSYKFESNHIHFNGEIMHNGFVPTFMAIYKGVGRRDQGMEGARFSIYPYGGRKITEEI